MAAIELLIKSVDVFFSSLIDCWVLVLGFFFQYSVYKSVMLVQITQLSSSSPEAYTPPEDTACKVKQTAEGGNGNKD